MTIEYRPMRLLIRIRLENRQKRALWNAYGTDHLHALLAGFLLFQELSFAGNVAAVAFGRDIFTEGADGAAGDDFSADGALNGDFIHLAGNFVLETVTGDERSGAGALAVNDLRKRVDLFAVDQNIHQNQIAFPVIDNIVIKRAIALRDGLEAVIEIKDDFPQRHLIG